MAEGSRPWWKSSAVKNSPLSSNARSPGRSNDCIQPKIPATPPKPINLSVVKQEAPDRCFPIFSPGAKCPPYSPNGKPVDCSRVKPEPLANIKTEPLSYIEQALVKGEFPYNFNWPVVKWEPMNGVPGTATACIKGDSKHYFPDFKNYKQSVFRRLGNKAPRDTNRPPPNWRYIYSRQSYEPTASARVWWNDDVERVLKKRRDAYLLTKIMDSAPVEVRMERLWSFEVAKDEARRVIAESKWRASQDPGDLNGINVGASCSSQPNPYLNNNNLRSPVSMNAGLPLNERLGQLAIINDDSSAKQTMESPRKDELSSVTSDEVQILAKDKENIEVLTIDDEIEDALNNSEDEDDIKVISETDSDVIFIQKKQGEVTLIAQIEGRMVKMNRKRKLCVTFPNCAKRQCTSAVDTEPCIPSDKERQDGDISTIDETVSNVRVANRLQDKSDSSEVLLFDLEKAPNGEGETKNDDDKDAENDGQDAAIDDRGGKERHTDAVANGDEDGSRGEEEVYEVLEDLPEDGSQADEEVYEVLDDLSDIEIASNGNENLNLDITKKLARNGTTVTSLAEILKNDNLIETDVDIVSQDKTDVDIVSQDKTDVDIVSQDKTDVDIVSQDEIVVEAVNDEPVIGKYKTRVTSVPSATRIITENEQNGILVDDSEDEVLVLDSDNQVGKRTVPVKEVDDILIIESSTCSDNDSIQEAAVNDKDCYETGLNLKGSGGDVSSAKTATGEVDETETDDERSSVEEKARVSHDFGDEKNKSVFSEEMSTDSARDIKAEALLLDDFLERNLVTPQDSLCVKTRKTVQSASDDEVIEILVTDHTAKDKKRDSLQLPAGTSSTRETNVKLPRRLTRQAILVSKQSSLDNQGSGECSPTSVPVGRNISFDSPRTRGRKRLENDTNSQSPTNTASTRSKRR